MSRRSKTAQLDEAALERLIKLQIKGGVDGIVPVGTTGESPTVDYEEHIRHHRAVGEIRRAAKSRCSPAPARNSTSEAIYLTQAAEKAGADGSLQVAPYYNKPTQEGLFQHFRAIARATKLPIVLYSIPGRCGIEIGVETVKRLARDCKNIVGIKEAGGSCDRVSQLRAALGPKFAILSGDDSLTLPFMAVGAQGVISVASNVIPREVVADGEGVRARRRAEGVAVAREILSAVQGFVHRDEPGAGQSRAGDDGTDRGGIPPAAGADERREPREAEGDAEGVRHFEMNH